MAEAKAHKDRAHAVLSASSAKRWMSCPPSARLADSYENKTSVYAEEGTLGHEIAEQYIRRDALPDTFDPKALAAKKKHKLYSDGLDRAAQEYASYVVERYQEALSHNPKAQLLLETVVHFSNYVPDGFGSCDSIIIDNDHIIVIDLKMGQGVHVYAENNPQLRLYALGAISGKATSLPLDRVTTTIHQPRIQNISSETISVDELLNWAETEVAPAAKLAYEGKGTHKAGDHCRFCPALGSCRTASDYHTEIAKHEFDTPNTLTNDEVAEVLERLDTLEAWAKAVKTYALDQLIMGKTITGWKAVQSASRRYIRDEEEAIFALEMEGIEKDKSTQTITKLRGLGDLDKLVGKGNLEKYLAGNIYKSDPEPALARSTDKRAIFNRTNEAISEFSDIA